MADVDEITGDPAIRDQLRQLINGLSGLVSSTRSLEQQTEVARVLTPLSLSATTTVPATQVLPKTAAEFDEGLPILVF